MDELHPHPPAQRSCEVAVIGGGAAGLAAALQLARSTRSVLVVDAGEPRNAPAAHMHGYLGHDGRPPGEFLAIGREEVRRYGGGILDGQVVGIAGDVESGFRLSLADETTVTARRVLVATGLVDELPAVPGLLGQWGRGVIHCPYCQGWEVRDRQLVVIDTGPMATHQALLFRQLSDRVTVVVHDGHGPDAEDRRRLAGRDIAVVDGPVVAVEVDDDAVCGVRLADGRFLDASAVVVAPRFVARAELFESLGVETVAAPMGVGEMVAADERGETSVPGVFVAGNVTDVSGQVLQAASAGSRAGAVINGDLVQDEAERAARPRMGDGAEDWDRRYGESDQLFSGAVNGAVVTECRTLTPGSALDVGCGEGGDAVWLAQRGWDVTAVDISDVALDRARAAADDAGVSVDFVRADITEDGLPGRHDLVSVQYPALRHSPDDGAVRALLGAVAPGGTLLVVGHDLEAMSTHRPHFDPADYVQPGDVARLLDGGWVVEVDERRPRVAPPGHDGPDIPDVVLRARRTA